MEFLRKFKLVITIVGIIVILGILVLAPYDAFMGNINITENRMEVSYRKANREYSTRMKLSEKKKLEINASAEEGELYLRVNQGNIEEIYNISNFNDELVLESFTEGYINVHLFNENARNVEVCIKPVD